MDDWPDLKGVEWSDLYPRLVLYAVGRLRRLQWRRGRPQSEDFVQRAIEKALSGERKYDIRKTLFQNLCQIISSNINHEIESYQNINVVSEGETVVNIVDHRPSPEDTSHHRQSVRNFLDYLSAYDADSRNVADQIINSGITNSNELALQLGVSVKEIENIKKRLRRHIENYPQIGEEETDHIRRSHENRKREWK